MSPIQHGPFSRPGLSLRYLVALAATAARTLRGQAKYIVALGKAAAGDAIQPRPFPVKTALGFRPGLSLWGSARQSEQSTSPSSRHFCTCSGLKVDSIYSALAREVRAIYVAISTPVLHMLCSALGTNGMAITGTLSPWRYLVTLGGGSCMWRQSNPGRLPVKSAWDFGLG